MSQSPPGVIAAAITCAVPMLNNTADAAFIRRRGREIREAAPCASLGPALLLPWSLWLAPARRTRKTIRGAPISTTAPAPIAASRPTSNAWRPRAAAAAIVRRTTCTSRRMGRRLPAEASRSAGREIQVGEGRIGYSGTCWRRPEIVIEIMGGAARRPPWVQLRTGDDQIGETSPCRTTVRKRPADAFGV